MAVVAFVVVVVVLVVGFSEKRLVRNAYLHVFFGFWNRPKFGDGGGFIFVVSHGFGYIAIAVFVATHSAVAIAILLPRMASCDAHVQS